MRPHASLNIGLAQNVPSYVTAQPWAWLTGRFNIAGAAARRRTGPHGPQISMYLRSAGLAGWVFYAAQRCCPSAWRFAVVWGCWGAVKQGVPALLCAEEMLRGCACSASALAPPVGPLGRWLRSRLVQRPCRRARVPRMRAQRPCRLCLQTGCICQAKAPAGRRCVDWRPCTLGAR